MLLNVKTKCELVSADGQVETFIYILMQRVAFYRSVHRFAELVWCLCFMCDCLLNLFRYFQESKSRIC